MGSQLTPLEAVLRFGPQPRLPIGGPHHPNSVQVQAAEAAARRQRVNRLMKILETRKHIAVLERDLTLSRASLAALEQEAGEEGARALASYKSPAAPVLPTLLLRRLQDKVKAKSSRLNPAVRFAVSPRGSPLPPGAVGGSTRVAVSGMSAGLGCLSPARALSRQSSARTPPLVAVRPPSTASSRASSRAAKRIELLGGSHHAHHSCCPRYAARTRTTTVSDPRVRLRVSTTASSGGSSTTSIRMPSKSMVSPYDGSPLLFWDCLGPMAFDFKGNSPKTPPTIPVAATLVLPKGKVSRSRGGGGRSERAMHRSPSPH